MWNQATLKSFLTHNDEREGDEGGEEGETPYPPTPLSRREFQTSTPFSPLYRSSSSSSFLGEAPSSSSSSTTQARKELAAALNEYWVRQLSKKLLR